MMKKILFYTVIFATFFTYNCDEEEEDITFEDDTIEFSKPNITNTELIDKIIGSFSTSVEMAAVIKDLKVPYSKNYIVPTSTANKYYSNFKKAFGLGLYSSDLGYLNVYNQANSIVEYLTVIKRLSDDLDIDQFFDFQVLKQLATNSENLDSLMFLSVNSYNRMSKHLRETRRSDLSALMVTGVWLEGLYLSCRVNKFKPSPELEKRIGSQKIILTDLMEVLSFFKEKPYFNQLIEDFKLIEEAYEGVIITIEKEEEKVVKIDGIHTIIQGEFTTVTITEEQLKDISDLVIKIRNKLISE